MTSPSVLMGFVAPSEHQVLVFLVQIGVLLGIARLLGQLFRQIGQPSVIGELLAGVILGPSVFGRLAPGAFDWLFPGDSVQSGMLFTVGWLGVMLLLVVTGFDTDLTLIGRLGRAVMWVTAGSLLLPFVFGLAGGFVAPATFIGAEADRTVFALFLATALTISSLPVIAKILNELGMLRRDFGQLTLASGMANDVIGWVMLGLIAGLAGSGVLDWESLVTTVIGLVVFLGVAVAVGQRVVDAVLSAMRRSGVGIGGWVTMAIVISLGLGAVTQALGVEAVLGAFIAGILLGRSRYARRDLEEQLETVTMSFLAPIFFATAGLRVDISLLADPEVALWAVIVIALATVSKFAGSMIGARLAGLHRREGMALGVALNARGALEIVIATVGLSLGVLNEASYAVVVVMAIVTSVMAPPLLRMVIAGWDGSADEQERLRREDRLERNLLVRRGRVVVVDTGDRSSMWAATLVEAAFPPEAAVTVVVDGETGSDLPGRLAGHRVEVMGHSGDLGRQVVTQATLGADVVVAGLPTPRATPTSTGAEVDLGRVAAAALLDAGVTAVLVRSPLGAGDGVGARRILLPVATTRPARAAAEFAIALAATTGARITMLHVSSPPDDGTVRRFLRTTLRSHERTVGSLADPMGERMVGPIERRATDEGVATERLFVDHPSRATAIIEAIGASRSDLVVVGVEARDADGEPYLGQTVEMILGSSPSAVAVIALPPT